MLITSRTNPKIKQIRRLFHRRHRQQAGLFFAEGIHLVQEAIAMQADISLLVLAPELLDEEQARKVAAIQQRARLPALQVTAEVLNSISPQDGHQGIAAVVRQRWERMEEIRLSPQSCWVALDQIRHPGSLGTILRVSDAVGGAGVVLIGDGSDPYDPTAVRASLGAIFSQRLVKTTFPEFAAWRRRQRAFVVGTSPRASVDYQAVSYRSPTVVFMGNDRLGLSPERQAICDILVSIPMIGRCDSHHVAVATGIVLYELFNQRRGAKKKPARRHASA